MVTELLQQLTETSYSYESHVQLINLLHKGFLAHVYPPTESGDSITREPKEYNLLAELRQARESMDTRFAVGEELWIDWLTDEMLIAASYEERMSVTELCEKAVENEPSSVKLWQMWVDWVTTNYASCNNLEGSDTARWTEDDKEVCRDLFTKDMILSVLDRAVAATQWRIDSGHLLWNRYAQALQENLPESSIAKEVEQLLNMFAQRLQTPHSAWEETAQSFWPLVSKYRPNDWEAVMQEIRELAAPGKKSIALREENEFSLQRAIESGDRTEMYNAFTTYLQWEKRLARKAKHQGPYDGHLRCALYERALLCFPAYADWWLDYVDYLTTANAPNSVLPLLKRAVNHCPWSGDLWSRWILQSDSEGNSRGDIEQIKHRATNSGLLDVGGMEELVKVLVQWCSYLRRHAFRPNCSEDDLDTAEVGITMALEDIRTAGAKIYGKNFQGDPLYRLERIQIKFLSEARRFDDARAIYTALVPKQKNCAEFWQTYYTWELWFWGLQRVMDTHRVETAENGPDKATALVQQALSQRSLDEPEKVLALYMNHFQQHESGERLKTALVDAREFSKHLAIRREKEAEAAAAAQQAQHPVQNTRLGGAAVVATGEKRKADGEELTNGHAEKRTKTASNEPAEVTTGEPSESASAQIKRDREHNTITLKNLSLDTRELDVKKFFRDIGAPLSIAVLQDKDGSTASAVVEFETHEDVLAAKTRNGRELNGHEVRIQGGTQSTLYVTNYPPEYDEAAIRKLFDSYGDISSVRFPSLKYESRRRFCYVQFLTTEMAQAAEAAMNDKMLDGVHKLVAKISDPDAKKQRSGAQAEGRELFVKNIERTVSEDEVKHFFEQYGSVVSMNMLKLPNGKKTGTAFIVLSSAEETNAALAADNKPFKGRILHVKISSAKGRAAPLDRARKEDVNIKHASSATPEPERRGSDVSMTTSQGGDNVQKNSRERKIAIFNLPDTVNDARIRTAMEPYGPLMKIQVRRGDNGAIVEFANLQDAFNVRQGVDCSSLGADVRTGDVGELLRKMNKRQEVTFAPGGVSRPMQRGGRRGGLGFKRGGASGLGGGEGRRNGESAAGEGQVKKSNSDFRDMMMKGKGGTSAAGGEGEN